MASVFIPLPYGVKMIFEWTEDGQICINVMWCAKLSATAVTLSDLVNIVTDMDQYRTNLRSMETSSKQVQKLTAIDWSVEDGQQSVLLPGANLFGANSGDRTPNNVAIVQSLKSGYTGRSRNGRSFMSGITETMLTANNLVSAATAAAYAAAYQTFKTALNADGYTPIVASFVSNGAPRVTALGTAITTLIIDQPTDSMRRRLPGRGV
jgi:hypothetical protein